MNEVFDYGVCIDCGCVPCMCYIAQKYNELWPNGISELELTELSTLIATDHEVNEHIRTKE